MPGPARQRGSGRDGSGTNEVRLLRELRSNEAVFRNMGDSETLSFEENDLRNFFYSMDPADGVAFGARLVPAAREYTWGDDPTMNVLLGSGAWSRGNGGWMSTDGTPGAPPLPGLSGVISTPDMDSLRRTIWH